MVLHRPFDKVFRSWSHVAVLRVLQDTATGFTGNHTARLAGMHPRWALKALTSLEELGLVRRQRGGRDHLFTLNRDNYLLMRGILPLYKLERTFFNEVTAAIAVAVNRQAVSAVLFGSVARREETPRSDLDLCFIVKSNHQRKNLQSSLDDLSPSLYKRFGVKIAPIYFTLDEFRKKARRSNPLVMQILEAGRIIAGKHPKALIRA